MFSVEFNRIQEDVKYNCFRLQCRGFLSICLNNEFDIMRKDDSYMRSRCVDAINIHDFLMASMPKEFIIRTGKKILKER